MTNDPQQTPPLFTHVDVTASSSATTAPRNVSVGDVVGLLQDLLAAQDRQCHLLEELVSQISATQRQRANELGQWRQANPRLARRCRRAAESLSQAQTQYLQNLTEEVMDNAENLSESDYMLNELIDRYGPRLAHLNGVLQVLSQLSIMPNPTNTPE